MAGVAYKRTLLTGGTGDALDSIDGSSLTAGSDFAFVFVDGVRYIYQYTNFGSAQTEIIPYIVVADSNPGNNAWQLQEEAVFMVENDCINGTYDIWQRGTSQTTTGYASADRFAYGSSGTTFVHSRQSHTVGQTDIPGSPKYYSRMVVTSSAGTGNYCNFVHRILDVTKYSGKRVAVKFHGKADVAKNIAIEGVQNFGSGGSTAVEELSAQKIALTATWKKNIAYIDFPSVSGKTVGNLSYSQIRFWMEAGSDWDANTDTLGQQSGTFEFSEIEIYISDRELTTHRRTEAETYHECLPYCWVPGTSAVAGAGYNVSTTECAVALRNPRPFIQAPSISGVVVANTRIVSNGSFITPSAYANGSTSDYAIITYTCTGLTGNHAANLYNYTQTIIFNAEL